MKILIATATAGAGHLQAAVALEEAWRLYRSQDEVKRLDILDYTSRFYRKAYAEGYVKVAEKTPELYAHAFRKSDNPTLVKKMTQLRRLSARIVAGGFIRWVDEWKPDIVLCPHFLPMEALGSVRGHRRHHQPRVVTVVTDFEAHALWMEPGVDLYAVATEGTKARLVARGVSSRKIVVTGIPVSQRFVKPKSRQALRKTLKIQYGPPVLLVLGGGLGMGPLAETLAEIDRVPGELQILVVAGRNEALRQALVRKRYRHPVRVLGFVSNMEELMTASDLIVTKPGGLTSSEALALGKPMLIVNPLPGQEAANSDFLLEHGAAAKVNRLEDLPYRLGSLLKPAKLKSMAKAAKRIGRPNAARAICRAVIGSLSIVVVGIALATFSPRRLQAACPIAPSEEMDCFPTLGSRGQAPESWNVDLHVWAYQPEQDSTRRKWLLAALMKSLGLEKEDPGNEMFERRVRRFLVANSQTKLSVQLGPQEYRLPFTGRSGHVRQTVNGFHHPTANTWVSYRVPSCPGDPRTFGGKVWLAGDEGVVILSDIDDTVKISHVKERWQLLRKTFLEPYEAVPGMSALYQRWATKYPDSFFLYVSASPWQLYDELHQLLSRAGFPEGILQLKRFRWKDQSFFSLFTDADKFKTPIVQAMLERFPKRTFILVGDSGEKDPEIYGNLARAFPERVQKIYIRLVDNSDSPDRWTRAFDGLPKEMWQLFHEASEIQTEGSPHVKA